MPHGLPGDLALDPYSLGISSGTSNLLNAFLVQPNPGRSNPMHGRNVYTWNGDEAFEDKSMQIPHTIADWMWTANQTFYTEVVMPWRVVNDIHVEWEQWEANAQFLAPNPHQAPAPLITQKHTKHIAHLIRYGISFQVEDGWAMTALGRQSILMGMGQIARSYQETANAEVIRALLHSAHAYQQHVRDNGKVRRADHITYLKRQRDHFASFQKDKNGPELWDVRTDTEANLYRGQFDTIILPEMMYTYITMVRPEKTDYYLRGPAGPEAIDSKGGVDVDSVQLSDSKEPRRWLNKKRVYPARAYYADGADPVELLAKPVQIGEYNWMTSEYVVYDKDYKSEHRDILIYDEDKDRYSRLTLKQAIEHCGIWDGNRVSRAAENADFPDFLCKENGDPIATVGDMPRSFLTDTVLDAMLTTLGTKNIAINSNIQDTLIGNEQPSFLNDDVLANIDMFQDVIPDTNESARNHVKTLFESSKNKQELYSNLKDHLIQHSVGMGGQFSNENHFNKWFEPRAKQMMNNPNVQIGMMLPINKDTIDYNTAIDRKYTSVARLQFTKTKMLELHKENVAIPMNFLILRPHATYRGRTAIKVLSGACGNMYYSMGHGEVGGDAARMITLIHSAAYMAAIVDKPWNVWAEPNLYIDRYLGGLGMGFYDVNSYRRRSTNGNALSIIVVALPPNETEFPNPLDISGRYNTDYSGGLIDIKHYNSLHYTTAPRYNAMYEFYSPSSALDDNDNPTVLPEDRHMNRICWAGAQFMMNPKTGSFDFYEVNTSPWGELVYPSCGRVRDGAEKYLDPVKMQGLMMQGKRN